MMHECRQQMIARGETAIPRWCPICGLGPCGTRVEGKKTVSLRMPKVVQWRPLPDITTFEMAQAIEALMGVAMGAKFPEDDVALMPPEVQRHFSVSDHPIFK